MKQRKAATIGVVELLDKFPDKQSIVACLENLRWDDMPTCTKCGSVDKPITYERLIQ